MVPAEPKLPLFFTEKVPGFAFFAALLYPPVFLHPLQSPSFVEPALEVVLCRLQQRLELTPVHYPQLSLRIWAVT